MELKLDAKFVRKIRKANWDCLVAEAIQEDISRSLTGIDFERWDDRKAAHEHACKMYDIKRKLATQLINMIGV